MAHDVVGPERSTVVNDAVPSDEERYSRQILFPGIGAEGQRRLANGRVAVVGCGATGSALAGLLARAGVGTLRIIDRDYVEASNLQRQSLFDETDAAESLPKAIAARQKIAAFNSAIVVESKVDDLVPENIEAMLEGMQLILDGTDNFETRYLINDYAVKNSIPWIYAAAVGSYCATMNVIPGETACLACIFPESPKGMVETCETAGILNSAVNLVASVAATEALKFLVGVNISGAETSIQGESLNVAQKRCATQNHPRRTLLSFDLWNNQHAEISAAQPRSDCLVCGGREFVHLAGKARPHITLCGRNSVQIHERHRVVDFAELGERLEPHGQVRHNEFVLKFWREPYEITLFPDGRAIIKGTNDAAVARSLYARYVGN
ncbi:MAG TPA: ThiF family adenylyltransferase [Candidatus Sulfotelmatobacter sp.]